MNTYLWTVTSMSTMPSPPAPINEYTVLAQYAVTATNGATPPVTASIGGSAQFPLPTDENGNYTPYADLTQEQVLGWIQAEPNLVINTEANLDGQIQSQVTPPVSLTAQPLPWQKLF
jgi:hypothetical protein